jgi:hypothetical protein
MATFSNLSVSTPGTYTMWVTGGGLNPTSFSEFVVVAPPLSATHWVFSKYPPFDLTAGSAFGFQVDAEDSNGNIVSSFDRGPATILLSTNTDPVPNGISLGVATVQNGEATFSDLAVSIPGTYTLWVTGGGLNATSLTGFVVVSSELATPPTVSMSQVLRRTLITGGGRHVKRTSELAGFELTFNEALNPVGAQNGANYELLQTTKHGRKTSSKPVRFQAVYSASSYTVSLKLFGKPAFTRGGLLILNPSGITDTSGDSLVGSVFFTILVHGRGITP